MRHSPSKASKLSTSRTSKASKQSIPLARCAAALKEAEESKITQHLLAGAPPNPLARPRTAPLSLACSASFTTQFTCVTSTKVQILSSHLPARL